MKNNNHNIKVRLNRSELAVPGSRIDFFEKAAKSDADIVFLDLEDSVSINQKSSARTNVIEAVNDIDWRSISGSKSIGLTAGASAPEILVNQVIEKFKNKYKAKIEFFEITKEEVQFKIPYSIRN